MATHFSILTWEILWTEEPGRRQSTGLQRVGLDWTSDGLMDCIDWFKPQQAGDPGKADVSVWVWRLERSMAQFSELMATLQDECQSTSFFNIILPPLKTSNGEVSLRGLGSQTCHLSMMFLLGEVPWGNGLGHSLSQGLRVSNSDHCLIISRLTAAWRQRGQTNS